MKDNSNKTTFIIISSLIILIVIVGIICIFTTPTSKNNNGNKNPLVPDVILQNCVPSGTVNLFDENNDPVKSICVKDTQGNISDLSKELDPTLVPIENFSNLIVTSPYSNSKLVIFIVVLGGLKYGFKSPDSNGNFPAGSLSLTNCVITQDHYLGVVYPNYPTNVNNDFILYTYDQSTKRAFFYEIQVNNTNISAVVPVVTTSSNYYYYNYDKTYNFLYVGPQLI